MESKTEEIITAGNIAYSQWRVKCVFEALWPASASVSVDRDVARKPPLAICVTVTSNLKERHSKQWQQTELK